MAIEGSGELERFFPALAGSGYRITSRATPRYNCIAWAAGDARRWWEPDEGEDCYWPGDAPREYTLDAYVAAFASIGFVTCGDGALEAGFEKVALFASGGEPTHASKQTADGAWSSKLGPLEDIAHPLRALDGEQYGRVARFLKRSKGEAP